MAAVSALDPIPKEEGLSLEPSPRSQRSEGTEDPERQSKHFEVRLCGLDVEKTGLVLMFLSALLFSIMGVFVKMAAGEEIRGMNIGGKEGRGCICG
eukprot:67315-Amorphochlora_amoeboformis.AAC.2